jgi:subtilisin family serine protease
MARSRTDARNASRPVAPRVGRPRQATRLAAAAFSVLALGAAPAPATEPAALARALLGEAGQVAPLRASMGPAEQKVDSHVRRHAWPHATAQGLSAMSLLASRERAWRHAGRVRVVVKVGRTASSDRAMLETAGLEIEIVNDRFDLVQGWIAEGAVPALAALPVVRSISPAWPARHSIGRVTSEGDAASRADQVRRLGPDGAGVVVGVISDGIDSVAASRASGDLPAVTVPSDPRCRRGSGDEGPAMLEIVHDLAPGASLLFSGPGTALEMTDAIECLADSGADVIVDDLFFAGEPFFEDGPVALTAAGAVAAGVSYHTAAGNYGDREYLAEDYRPGPEEFHDFDPGAGQDILNRVVVPPGGELLCVLQWADPFGASGNDYDLIAVEPLTVTILDASTTVQNGTQDPIEVVAIANPFAFSLEVGIAILRYAGLARSLKLLCPSGLPLQYASSQHGISGHAARPEVIAVAAIDVADPGLDDPEAFTSQGPASIALPSPVARPKPDLAAFDGVATAAPGFATFFGTSAAAPHAAAVAALLLSKTPSLSPAEVQAALTSTAVDIAAPGFDTVAGHGRIDALAAINAVGATTTTTTVAATTTSTVSPATTTTLPACDPADCDGDACTVGDACVAGACRAGMSMTPALLSALVRDAANVATPCASDRRKSVRKVLKPIIRTARLLGHAGSAASERKRSKTLSRARRAIRQASRKLARTERALSTACAGALRAAIARADTGASCLP